MRHRRTSLIGQLCEGHPYPRPYRPLVRALHGDTTTACVLVQLEFIHGYDGWERLDRDALANLIGLSVKQVRRAVERLVDLGLVKVKRAGRGGPFHVRLNEAAVADLVTSHLSLPTRYKETAEEPEVCPNGHGSLPNRANFEEVDLLDKGLKIEGKDIHVDLAVAKANEEHVGDGLPSEVELTLFGVAPKPKSKLKERVHRLDCMEEAIAWWNSFAKEAGLPTARMPLSDKSDRWKNVAEVWPRLREHLDVLEDELRNLNDFALGRESWSGLSFDYVFHPKMDNVEKVLTGKYRRRAAGSRGHLDPGAIYQHSLNVLRESRRKRDESHQP